MNKHKLHMVFFFTVSMKVVTMIALSLILGNLQPLVELCLQRVVMMA